MKEKIVRLLHEDKNETGYVRRVLAYAIDWYVGGVVASLPIIIIYMQIYKEATSIPQELSIFVYPMNVIAGISSVIVALCYYVGIPCLMWKGQTLGKKIVGLKIVSHCYLEASMKQLLMRQAVIIFLLEGSLYTSSNMLHQVLTIVTPFNITTIYAYVGLMITILSAILIILLPSKKALHDIVTNTTVVHLHSNQYSIKQKRIKNVCTR